MKREKDELSAKLAAAERDLEMLSVQKGQLREEVVNLSARLAAYQQSHPCVHEWYQGACCHCAMTASEFRARAK